jgi:hypothetical protein
MSIFDRVFLVQGCPNCPTSMCPTLPVWKASQRRRTSTPPPPPPTRAKLHDHQNISSIVAYIFNIVVETSDEFYFFYQSKPRLKG